MFLSTDMLDPKIRDDFWRELIRPVFDISSPCDEKGNGFIGTMQSRPFGRMVIGTTTFNGQKYQRTPRIIAQGGLDYYILQVLLVGRLWSDCNGNVVEARPGDIVILDLARTISSEAEAGARLTLMLPRASVDKQVGRRNLHGMVLSGASASIRLLVDYLKGINAVAGQLTPQEASAVEEAMLILLVAGITNTGGAAPDMPVTLPMRQRILDYIDAGLTDPMLGPQTIMRHFHISRSHLYRAFEADGGVAHIIRDKRLDLAWRMLSGRREKPLSLKAIAWRCGFQHGTQFGKFFRARYGFSPKEAQGMALPFFAPATGFNFHEHLVQQAKLAGIIPNV